MRVEYLIEHLSKNQRFKALVEGITNLQESEVIDSLLLEFEKIVERYKTLSDFTRLAPQAASQDSAVSSSPAHIKVPSKRQESPQGTTEKSPLTLSPLRIDVPRIDFSAIQRSVATRQAEEDRKIQLRKELDIIEDLVNKEIERDWSNKVDEIRETIIHLKTSQRSLREELKIIERQEASAENVVPSSTATRVNEPPLIGEEAVVFVYAATNGSIPLHADVMNSISSISGIDGKNNLFLAEQEGKRLVVSNVQPDSITVTKSGVVLLGKEESLQLRQRFEEIQNALRCWLSILSFEFGTVISGRESFDRLVGSAVSRLSSAQALEAATVKWRLNLYALDSRIDHLVPKTTQRTIERTRESRIQVKRFDFKRHEKILQLERQFADEIHSILASCAGAVSVEASVGMGSGTSEDWKLILQATYEVSEERRQSFFNALAAIQGEYKGKGLLLEVLGAAGRFSLANA